MYGSLIPEDVMKVREAIRQEGYGIASHPLLSLVHIKDDKLDTAFISHIDAFYLSVAIGCSDWMDERIIDNSTKGAATYTYCRQWFNWQLDDALNSHFRNILSDGNPNARVKTKTNRAVSEHKKRMGWKKWGDGYYGVMIRPERSFIVERARVLVRFFRERWREFPGSYEYEKKYVFDRFGQLSSLDWLLDEEFVTARIEELEAKRWEKG